MLVMTWWRGDGAYYDEVGGDGYDGDEYYSGTSSAVMLL